MRQIFHDQKADMSSTGTIGLIILVAGILFIILAFVFPGCCPIGLIALIIGGVLFYMDNEEQKKMQAYGYYPPPPPPAYYGYSPPPPPPPYGYPAPPPAPYGYPSQPPPLQQPGRAPGYGQKYCPSCRRMISADSNICPHCRYDFRMRR